MRKNPVIGSVTSRSRIGNIARVTAVDAFDTITRVRSARPCAVPPPAYREAMTTSTSPRENLRHSSGIFSGGCCRSPSMTRHASDSAAAKPSSTAPPSPPTAFSRCSTRTGSGADAATSRITSGVASVLSSTKTISASMPPGTSSSAAATRRTSSATLGASLYVGTMIDSCIARHPAMQR